MTKERFPKRIGEKVNSAAAAGLFLIDSFLLSPVRNIATMYEERGFVEGTKTSLPTVLLPVAAATLTYAITRRIDASIAVGAAVYLFEGAVCDYQEFTEAMDNPAFLQKRWLYPLIEKIHPSDPII